MSLLEQCKQVSAHHGDRYQPFLKKFYGSHRKALFRVIKTLDLRSTTSDQTLVDAMNFIMANEHNPKQYLEATLDLSFTNKKWQRTILVRRKGKSWYRRQHLETCVFSSLADELKSGDICVIGSEQFADYRAVDGIQIPFTASRKLGPQTVERHATEIKINAPIDPSQFKRPAS